MDRKPKKGEYVEVLLRSPQTIFTPKDAALIWGEEKEHTVSARLNKYVASGKLIRVRRGVYAKDRHYDAFELATKIYTPAYISFETVLAKAGVVFQFYSRIFVASYITREIQIEGKTIEYRKIKDSILTNNTGIETRGTYHIASPERAFLDVMYISTGYYFDNISSLDWATVLSILPIYNNKNMERRVRKCYSSITSSS